MGQLLQITHVSDDSSGAMDTGCRLGGLVERGDRTSMEKHEPSSCSNASGTRNASAGDRVERSRAHFIKLCEQQRSGPAPRTHLLHDRSRLAPKYRRPVEYFDRHRAHPWHGLSIGESPPDVIDAYIEITPYDAVKYEIDKRSGYLRVDRPQGSSALPPTLYGFIPRTYCDDRVAALTPHAEIGDRDPLDVCVISEQRIDRADIVVSARVVGGIQLLDEGEADDKIVAILRSDRVYDGAHELEDLPEALLRRIVHYFATYKLLPGAPDVNSIEVVGTYGADHARAVIAAAAADYADAFDV